MILTKTVLITLNPMNIKHYESQGYFIPKYIDKQNRLRIKKGTKIEVKVSDLPIKATIKIRRKCDICGNERMIEFYLYTNICKKCFYKTDEYKQKRSGINHPFYNQQLTNEERVSNKKRSLIPNYSKSIKEVKQRDKYCVICKSKENLRVHHINDFKHFPELRCDKNNLITLCHEHHNSKNGKSIHNLHGNFPSKENWEEFYSKYHIS